MPNFVQIAIIACIIAVSSTTGAAPGKFTPSYHTIKADLRAQGIYEKNRSSTPENSKNDSELVLQEFIEIYGYGYIYSPLFITLETSIGGGLEQRRIKEEETTEIERESFLLFHKFHFLPTHPYNLELFTSRTNPMSGSQANDNSSREKDLIGAKFHYTQNPLLSTVSWEKHDSTDNDIESLLVNLNYTQPDFHVGNSYNYSETKQDNIDSNYNFYNIFFHKKLTPFSINGYWINTRFDQDDQTTGDTTKTRGETYSGEIIPYLPHKFTSVLSLKRSENQHITEGNSTNNQLTNNNNTVLFRLNHRLFTSLTNTLTSSYQMNESGRNHQPLGESDTLNLQINSRYTKEIRPGHIGISLQGGLSDLDNKGFSVATESHPSDGGNYNRIDLLIEFDLLHKQVDSDSIILTIRFTDDKYQKLTENLHWQQITENDITTITINNVPAGTDEFAIEATYIHGQPIAYKLRTTNWGYSLNLRLFNNLIKPGYIFTASNQEELDGNYSGELNDVTSHQLSCEFSKPPINGKISRGWQKSNTQRQDKLNSNVRYQKKISELSNGSISIDYENIVQKDIDDRTEDDRYTATAQYQTSWPHKNIRGAILGNYSLIKGSNDNTSYSLQSNLRWYFGKLNLNFNAIYSNSESTTGDKTSTTENTTIKFNLTRNLF